MPAPEYEYSAEGKQLTMTEEALRLESYKDSGGVWTIGYGHTGPEVHEGLVWTREQAVAAFNEDTGK